MLQAWNVYGTLMYLALRISDSQWFAYHVTVLNLATCFTFHSAALRVTTRIQLMNAESNPLRKYNEYCRG